MLIEPTPTLYVRRQIDRSADQKRYFVGVHTYLNASRDEPRSAISKLRTIYSIFREELPRHFDLCAQMPSES